jgi:hypothetical protein
MLRLIEFPKNILKWTYNDAQEYFEEIFDDFERTSCLCFVPNDETLHKMMMVFSTTVLRQINCSAIVSKDGRWFKIRTPWGPITYTVGPDFK